jgi:hypothetical protein
VNEFYTAKLIALKPNPAQSTGGRWDITNALQRRPRRRPALQKTKCREEHHAPPTPPASGAAVKATSKYMFNAERFAKSGGCVSPVATMHIAMATYETFTIACASGDPLSIRCDDGNCRALQ